MKEEKILTKHPDKTKTGRSISRERYDSVKKAMLDILKRGDLSHTELMDSMRRELNGKFDGNIGWYSETVKLDLEARKIVERIGSKPQKYRLR